MDAMVVFDQPTFPWVIIRCRALGVDRLKQKIRGQRNWQRNDRLIAIPLKAARLYRLRQPNDLSQRQRDELGRFFLSAILFEDKRAKFLGWGYRKKAEALVTESSTAF
jgi:inorganic pyrophosphatase